MMVDQNKAFDYSEFQEENPTPAVDLLSRISVVADQLMAKKKAAAEAELALKKINDEVSRLEEVELPQMMREARQEEMKTTSGIRLKLVNEIHTNISKDRKPKAIAWLDANGQGGIVRRNVIIAFNKCDEDKVEKLLRLIGRGWPSFKVELDVHAATVKSLVKERLAAGLDVPLDIFGVYRREVVLVEI
jgi:hypothetical protein